MISGGRPTHSRSFLGCPSGDNFQARVLLLLQAPHLNLLPLPGWMNMLSSRRDCGMSGLISTNVMRFQVETMLLEHTNLMWWPNQSSLGCFRGSGHWVRDCRNL